MNAFFKKATMVAILLCVAGCNVHGEPDYVLPGGPPPTSATVLLTNPGKPLQPPTLLTQVRPQRPHSKIVESFLSSEFTLFGGGPPHNFPKRYQFTRLPHPNSIPRGPQPKPFEVVRAPVIYHQTVTDTDVTKALADAFDVVEKLRKPGNKVQAIPQDDPPTHITTVEFLNHAEPENTQGRTATTTTTIVEAPQQLNSEQQNHQHRAVTLGQVTLVSNPEQSLVRDLPPIPAAADYPPPPPQTNSVVVATSAPVVAEVVPVLPATTTSTSPSPAVPPKLIIPSQRHVTTLAEAVQSSDPQVRTIIQPVYIPYPVDQNGRPFGPLPDYHSMDFRLLLSAQKQILEAASRVPAAQIQYLEPQPTVETSQQLSVNSQQRPLQQEYYVQQQVDQNVAAAGDLSRSMPSTLPTKTRKRIARRRNNPVRRT